jgi:hypothetical protein
MAKARSPQYPSIGLKEAVERAADVYNKDYQNPIPRSVAVTHMGYQSLNGKSLGVLSALLKFGLLEGRGDETKVSDLAVSIIAHPPGSPERAESLRQAAGRPELFAELDARFQGGRASDQALRSYLLTQKFIPTAADAAIRSYRETKMLVDGESVGYPSPEAVTPSEAVVLEPRSSATTNTVALTATGIMSNRQTVTLTWTGEKGVSESSIGIKDDRIELAALLYDQAGVQKVIDRLNAVKALLPEHSKSQAQPETKEAAN